jgi:hypothetical protein
MSLAGCAASGVLAERTRLGRRVTGALTSFSMAAVASNLSWLPPAHPFYDACWATVLPASLAVTVLGAARLPRPAGGAPPIGAALSRSSRSRYSLPRIGGVGLAFGVGACGSLLGATAAFGVATHAVPPGHALRLPLPVAAQCAACCAATYIGGSANLFAVAQACGLARDHAGALGALAAGDVLCMGGYFALLVALSQSAWVRARVDGESTAPLGSRETKTGAAAAVSVRAAVRAVATLSLLALAGALLQAASALAHAPGCRAVPGAATGLLTLLASGAAAGLGRLEGLAADAAARTTTAVDEAAEERCLGGFRRRVILAVHALAPARAEAAPPLASALLLLFFAAVGAAARVDAVTSGGGPALVAFVAVTLAVHCAFTAMAVLALNQLLGPRSNDQEATGLSRQAISLDEALVASNANVGGPATAAGFAGSLLLRPDLVPAAAGWGTLGYALASSLALGLHAALLRG